MPTLSHRFTSQIPTPPHPTQPALSPTSMPPPHILFIVLSIIHLVNPNTLFHLDYIENSEWVLLNLDCTSISFPCLRSDALPPSPLYRQLLGLARNLSLEENSAPGQFQRWAQRDRNQECGRWFLESLMMSFHACHLCISRYTLICNHALMRLALLVVLCTSIRTRTLSNPTAHAPQHSPKQSPPNCVMKFCTP